jgi:hypothetical protein
MLVSFGSSTPASAARGLEHTCRVDSESGQTLGPEDAPSNMSLITQSITLDVLPL